MFIMQNKAELLHGDNLSAVNSTNTSKFDFFDTKKEMVSNRMPSNNSDRKLTD